MSRLISAILVILLVTGGAALAVSGGPSNGKNAAISQYEPTQGTKGVQGGGGETNPGGGGSPRSEVRGASGEGNVESVETASTGPAAAATGLPFTGSDVLALAGIGLLLILAGVAQRRLGSKRHG